MIALLIAAGLFAAPGRPVLIETSPLIVTPAACREKKQITKNDIRQTPRKLGDLPTATAEYALMRKVEGCMVPVPMSLRGPGPKP